MKYYNTKKYKTILAEQLVYKRKAVLLLTAYFKCDEKDLFYFYIKGKYPETGKITDKIFFFFHGLGCSIKNEEENWAIDLEFGPKGNALAFDKGTICYLLNEKMNVCDDFINYLVDEKIIKLINEELYMLVKAYPKYNSWVSIEEDIDASVADRYMVIENNKPKELGRGWCLDFFHHLFKKVTNTYMRHSDNNVKNELEK